MKVLIVGTVLWLSFLPNGLSAAERDNKEGPPPVRVAIQESVAPRQGPQTVFTTRQKWAIGITFVGASAFSWVAYSLSDLKQHGTALPSGDGQRICYQSGSADNWPLIAAIWNGLFQGSTLLLAQYVPHRILTLVGR